MLRKVESLKVKDSWLEKCEVTRIKARSATVEQVRSAVEHGVERDKLRAISEDSEYPTAQGAPDWSQAGSFNGVCIDAFLLARRMLQKDRNELRSCDLVTKVWRIRLATNGFHTANAQRAILKYLEGGHATELPVTKTLKDYALGRVTLSDATASVEHFDEYRPHLEGWLLPPKVEKYNDDWDELRPHDWSIGLKFLKKIAKNIYQLGRPPFIEGSDAYAELEIEGKRQVIMKSSYTAAAKAVAAGYGFGPGQCSINFESQKWDRLPYISTMEAKLSPRI